ncbi:MAG: VCBS repeat-containing protein, partial [Hyphomicrobiaceae bacterium]|nr:VCBS repeat-containing protein [Hyphomicrobiaceae bacterium]
LLGDGKPAVHVASIGGEQLFVYDASSENVVVRKLAAKSRAGVWGEFNGDGRFDLASFDGKVLTLLLQKGDGTFAPSATTVKIPADCRGLAVMGLGTTGKVALVAAGNPSPVFVCDGKGSFTAVALPKAEKAVDIGVPQMPVVGDFTDDALADLIQPGETGGLLYVAKADGSFAAPTSCNVWCGKGGGKSWVGDFDGDGWADILVTGAEKLRIFQNNRKGVFAEMRMASGEVSYKAYGTTGGGVCDFNNDGLQDLYVTQPDQPPFLYFNRGFRSFALAPIVGRELASKLAGLDAGQQGGLFVDLNRDAAEDFVLVRTDGTIWMVANDLGGGVMAARPHVSAAAARGASVSVKAYLDKRLLGVWQAVPGGAAPTIGVRFATDELELKYRFPGQKVQSQKVPIEEEGVDVVLKPTK